MTVETLPPAATPLDPVDRVINTGVCAMPGMLAYLVTAREPDRPFSTTDFCGILGTEDTSLRAGRYDFREVLVNSCVPAQLVSATTKPGRYKAEVPAVQANPDRLEVGTAVLGVILGLELGGRFSASAIFGGANSGAKNGYIRGPLIRLQTLDTIAQSPGGTATLTNLWDTVPASPSAVRHAVTGLKAAGILIGVCKNSNPAERRIVVTDPEANPPRWGRMRKLATGLNEAAAKLYTGRDHVIDGMLLLDTVQDLYPELDRDAVWTQFLKHQPTSLTLADGDLFGGDPHQPGKTLFKTRIGLSPEYEETTLDLTDSIRSLKTDPKFRAAAHTLAMAIIDSPVAVRYLLEKARGIASASGAVGKLAWMSVVQGEYEEDWQLQAACRTADPELFFPLEGESSGATETARDICKKCQVIGSCLKLAVETGEDFGIWAGTTENERREQASLMRAAHAVKAELARVRASQS